MTTTDYIPTFDSEDIASRRYLYIFIIQNTNGVKTHKEKILEFLEERYAKGMEYHREFGSEVSFTYILFDKEPSTFICHDINKFKDAFDCATETEQSAGMETLSSFLKKYMEGNPLYIYNEDLWKDLPLELIMEEYRHTMYDVFFIGDGNDYMDDKMDILNQIDKFRYYRNNHCIAFYKPDMQYMGDGNKYNERTHSFFQIKRPTIEIQKPTIDWKGLMQVNDEFIRMEEENKMIEEARKQEEPYKTYEELLEEMEELLSKQEQEGSLRFEVKDDRVFVHGYADLENREGYPVGNGIVFFSGKGAYHHELYIANALTGKIRHLSTDGGRLLVGDDEIDYETIEKICKHGKQNARLKVIKYAGINRWDGFRNGLCAISWMLYPEGRYFEDSDGFGGDDNDEENVYAIMDTNLNFIEPFRPIKDIRVYLTKIRTQSSLNSFEQ